MSRFSALLDRCANPAAFVETGLQEVIWSKQREVLTALGDHRRVAVHSCHAAGKTRLASRAMLWGFCCLHPFAGISTAPTWRQVNSVLWGELRKAAHSSLVPLDSGRGPLRQPIWDAAPDHYMAGIASNRPDNLQGIHEENGIIVIDEAGGVPEELWPAITSLAAGGNWRVLAIGNPDSRQTEFYRICQPGSGWHVLGIGYQDTPNFTGEALPDRIKASLISREYVEQMRLRYGEQSAVFRSKCLGLFPTSDADALIPSDWIAVARERTRRGGPVYAGLDVARYGADDSVLATVRGNALTIDRHWHGLPGDYLAGNVAAILRQLSPAQITGDADGLGGPIMDSLRGMGFPVVDFYGAASAPVAQPGEIPCYDARSAAYWALRAAIRDWLALPDDDSLLQELEAHEYTFRVHPYIKREAILVRPKEEIKTKLKRSPDRSDAAAYAVAAMTARTGVWIGGKQC